MEGLRGSEALLPELLGRHAKLWPIAASLLSATELRKQTLLDLVVTSTFMAPPVGRLRAVAQ
jgi:hypothetical protein